MTTIGILTKILNGGGTGGGAACFTLQPPNVGIGGGFGLGGVEVAAGGADGETSTT